MIRDLLDEIKRLYHLQKGGFIGSMIIGALISLYVAGYTKRLWGSIGTGEAVSKGFFKNVLSGFLNPLMTLFLLLLIFIIVIMILHVRYINAIEEEDVRFNVSDKDDRGSASEMGEDEMKGTYDKVRPADAETLILGWADKAHTKVLVYNKEMLKSISPHIAVCGVTGSRKTSNIVYPMIISSIRQGHSFICTDTSGEAAGQWMNFCKQNGYTVRYLNLLNPAASDGFNPMIVMDYKKGDEVTRARQITKLLTANLAKGNDPYFTDESEDFYTMAQLYIANPGADDGGCSNDDNNRNLNALAEFASDARSAVEKLSNLPDGHPARRAARMFINTEPKAQDRITRGAYMKLSSLLDENLANIVSHNDIDLQLPGKEKCAYFVSVSASEDSNHWLASLFYGCLFIALVDTLAAQKLDKRLDVPVDMIFDEFPNIFSIPNFGGIMDNVRKNGISIALFYQSIPAMETAFPHGVWKRFLASCDTQIFLASNEMDTSKYFSELTGEGTIDTKSESHHEVLGAKIDPFSYSEREGTAGRMIMTSDEVRRMEITRQMIITRGKRFKTADMFFWKDHPISKQVKEAGVVDTTSYIPHWRRKVNAQDAIDEMGEDVTESEVREINEETKSESGSSGF